MQIGELAGLAVGSTVLLNVMFAGYMYMLTRSFLIDTCTCVHANDAYTVMWNAGQ